MENMVIPFVIAMVAIVVPLSLVLAFRLVGKLRQTSDRPLSQDIPGVTTVPVRCLTRTFGFLGHSRNGLSPRLELVSDGVRFKVFKPDFWRFEEIAKIDAAPVPFSFRLELRNKSGALLYIDVANRERARDLLRVLPAKLAYTRRALDVRGAA